MEKDIFSINQNDLSYGRGYVYSLQYHLVWCTKYRKRVLKDGIDTECKKMLQELAEGYQGYSQSASLLAHIKLVLRTNFINFRFRLWR